MSFPDYDALTGSLRPGMAEAIEAGGGTVFQVADWHDDDEVTTTFGSIRQGMAEAAEAERERIIELIKIVDYTVLVKTDDHDELDVMEQEELFALIRSAQK